MKKVYPIFLILILFGPVLGTFVFLHEFRIKARKEARELILSGPDRENLVLLKFTALESATLLFWEHPGEFEYFNQMYDIVETETFGDTIYYWCYADHKETRVNKAIDRAVAKASGQDPVRKNQTERLNDFFKTLFFNEIHNWKTADLTLFILHYSSFNFQYSSPVFTPPSPPPKES